MSDWKSRVIETTSCHPLCYSSLSPSLSLFSTQEKERRRDKWIQETARDTYNTFQSQTWQILCVLYMSSIVHLSHRERKKVSSFPPSVSEPFILLFFSAGQTDPWKKRGIISLFAVGRGFQVTILVKAGKEVESLSILQIIFSSSPSRYFVVNDEDDRLKKDQNSTKRDEGSVHLCISHDTIHKTDKDSFFKEEKKRFYIPHKTKISGYWIWKNRALDLSFSGQQRSFPSSVSQEKEYSLTLMHEPSFGSIPWKKDTREKSPLQEKKSLASSSVTSFTRNIPLK